MSTPFTSTKPLSHRVIAPAQYELYVELDDSELAIAVARALRLAYSGVNIAVNVALSPDMASLDLGTNDEVLIQFCSNCIVIRLNNQVFYLSISDVEFYTKLVFTTMVTKFPKEQLYVEFTDFLDDYFGGEAVFK